MGQPCFVGLDIGTSGCRAIAIDSLGGEVSHAEVAIRAPARAASGRIEQDPEHWWRASCQVLGALAARLGSHSPAALCVDATSATLLLADARGRPLGPALMYNDQSAAEAAARIAPVAPAQSPALGASASLAKLIALGDRLGAAPGTRALHQADWIGGRLSGCFDVSDWNNALKLGFDVEGLGWPGWVLTLVPQTIALPRIVAPGSLIGRLDGTVAAAIGFPPETAVLAGTTDSTAAAIAAGVSRPGDAVTSLGSTLVVKVVSEHPVNASRYGVYSHRFGDHWLVGGASNSGGAVLRQFFSDGELEALSRAIDPETDTGLDYYPLAGRGERFPRQAPDLEPRLQPRPADPVRFLQGLLEGIADIEAEGYARLAELGAAIPTRVRTVGGGAANAVWTRIRARRLGCPVEPAARPEAAFGAATLALSGARAAALVRNGDGR
ncbi:FGGY-family carbohydrate kinase [Thiocystis violacea]|uniref:FGGY-family carbohydrate kinase n=1 Tax=Thiocystis violacea TaxID=13725 RepID=UPI001904DE9D|nr:FGGY-family carbohydrate kinase [Thiocystis violacea]MBK1721963.1 carbohydrate kinase [Thiocystis violacea]